MTVKGESLREMVQLQRKMNQLFDEMLHPERPAPTLPDYEWVPAADVYEDAGSFFVDIELPGVQIAHVDLVCTGNTLRITGERKPLLELTRQSVQRMERYLGAFGREFSFPEALEPEKIEARLENGVLAVRIPKREKRAITAR